MRSPRMPVLFGLAVGVVTLLTVLTVRQVPLASAVVAPPGPAALAPASTPSLRQDDGIELPRVVHSEKPVYTAEALEAKIQGSVRLDVLVREFGAVGRVNVVESLDAVHGLDEAAIHAARRWRFEPGRKDGVAVPVTVTLEMTFTLKD